LKSLRIYYKKYWVRSILGGLAKVVEAIFELLMPVAMAKLIDQGIIPNNQSVIINMSLILLGLTVVGYGFTMFCQYQASIVSQAFAGDLRNIIYKKINTFGYEELNKYSSSKLNRILNNDTTMVGTGVARTIRLLLRAPFLLVGSFIGLMIINTQLGLILFAGTLVVGIILALIMYFSMKSYRRILKNIDTTARITKENKEGIRIIKAYNHSMKEVKRFDENQDLMYKYEKIFGFFNSLGNPISFLIINVVLVILLYFCAIEFNNGAFLQGSVLTLISYTNQMLYAIVVSMNLLIIFSKSFTSSARIKEILSIEPIVYNNDLNNKHSLKVEDVIATDHENIVTLKKVSMKFEDSKTDFLKNLSFEIRTGEMVGLTGLTGSGKSILTSILLKNYLINQGEYLIKGYNSEKIISTDVKKIITTTSQERKLLNLSIKENIILDKNFDEVLFREVCKITLVDEVLVSKGNDIEYIVGDNGKNLSGGQKARLLIARALYKNTDLTILDDALSPLDNITTTLVLKNLKNFLKKNSEKAILICAAKERILKECSKVIFIDEGEILGFDSNEELLKSNLVYRRLMHGGSEE